MKKLVFIHGAWHNESCWEKVTTLLKKKDIESVCLTMAGNQPDRSSEETSYQDIIDSIKKGLAETEGPFTLVVHSSGGHVVQHAAPQFEDKIEKIIFNNSWLLPNGKSQFDLVGDEEIKAGMRAAAKAHPANCIPLDEGFFRNALAQDASKETQDELLSILVPQPLSIMEAKADTEAFQRIKVPMSLLYCKDDISLPPGAFKGMFSSFVPEGDIAEIEGGHETLFVNPGNFVDGLLKLI